MREIKFRAFKDGSWWYSDDEAYNLKEYDGVLYLCEDVKFYRNTEEHELEIIGVAYQYTGLKDKDGVDIYEGDIIESIWNGRKYQIEWDESYGEWCFCSDTTGQSKYSESIVIGNIYENPELLRED